MFAASLLVINSLQRGPFAGSVRLGNQCLAPGKMRFGALFGCLEGGIGLDDALGQLIAQFAGCEIPSLVCRRDLDAHLLIQLVLSGDELADSALQALQQLKRLCYPEMATHSRS